MKLFSIFILLLLIACNQTKFEKSKWLYEEDMEYPYRKSMVKDLTTNYQLKGLSYKQLIALLGEPGNITGDSNEIYYPIIEEYDVIDPIHSIDLAIRFNNDSIISNWKINEWKKN
jgi:hypothetical protein